MPRTTEQLDRIREESREKILRSALRLFAERGYAATSVRMIAGEAGISQGLLYNYYGGKEALLRAIFERSMEDVHASFASPARAPSPREALEVLVRSALEVVRGNRLFWQLSYQLRMQTAVLAGLGGETSLWSGSIRSHLEELLRGAGVAGAPGAARALFAAIDGAAQHYVLDPEHYPLEEVAEEITRRFLPAEQQ